MDRDIPTFNQLIVSKINQKNLHLHQQRLQNIRVILAAISHPNSPVGTLS